MPATQASATQSHAVQHAGFFRQFLSELNPLQYIPVIGTLYRAVTHDTIPDAAREAGSLVVSFLTGGPVGIAINLGSLAAEQATGIDPEKLGQSLLAGIGIGNSPDAAGKVQAANKSAGPPIVQVSESAVTPTPPPAPHAWSAAQLAAYGVTRTANNELVRGGLKGSDVLNELELATHQPGNKS
jgi:hypothetical protein